MAEKKDITISNDGKITQTIIQDEKKIICDLCGYANPAFTAICKKCSNYLTEKK